MSISQNRYVSINSAVAGAPIVNGRQYIARLFTDNILLPPHTYVEFTNITDVGNYFGFNSQEYYRAQYYFAFNSKENTQAELISFARWVDAAVAPMVFGFVNPLVPQSAATYTSPAITNGSLGITVDGVPFTFTGINFTGDVTLADVATTLQTAITGSLVSATVVYDAATANFVLSTGVPGNHTISIQGGLGGTDLVPLLNWSPAMVITNGKISPVPGYAVTAAGSVAETPVQSLTTSMGYSNNFGSFAFMPSIQSLVLTSGSNVVPTTNTAPLAVGMSVEGLGIPAGSMIGAITTNTSFTLVQVASPSSPSNATTSGTYPLAFYLSLSQAELLAAFNKALNVEFMYQLSVNSGNALVWHAGLAAIGGVGITLESGVLAPVGSLDPYYPVEYPEMLPMVVQATTDYNGVNTVQNYEFQQSLGLSPSVTSDASANLYDPLSINYYGQTQSAGKLINFYQKGVLQGLATDPLDMNVYANEIWLKDAIAASLLNLLLTVTQVPANAQGQNMILTVIQSVINQALVNGTISVNKPLTELQIVKINEITGDPTAYYQVQTLGYWIAVVIDPIASTATYTLVYSKDDVIRKVVGSNNLI